MLNDVGPVEVLTAVATVVAACAAVVVAWFTARTLPRIQRDLAASDFLVSELDDLLRLRAYGPQKSLDKQKENPDPVLLRKIKDARHDPVFDRVVFEFVGAVPSYTIVPLTEDELREMDVQGVWGLKVSLTPCRVRYSDGPNVGRMAIEETKSYLGFPAVTDYRLVNENGNECDWAIGSPRATRYLAFELSGPPRLVVDFFRQTSA